LGWRELNTLTGRIRKAINLYDNQSIFIEIKNAALQPQSVNPDDNRREKFDIKPYIH